MIRSLHACGRVLGLAALMALHSLTALGQRPPISSSLNTTNRPDEFGTQDYTVTVIPAGSFTADKQTVTNYGSLYRYFGEEDPHGGAGEIYSGHLYAGVNVPAGVVIDFVGLQTYDCYGGNNVATLFSVDRYSGTTSGVVSMASTSHSGCDASDYNAVPLGFLWTENAHNALVLDLYIPGGADYHSRGILGWVEIWWKRTVSPAPATPSFTDVPTTDQGYQYIEALKASGITGGCGGGNYCPEATLTRRQMAVFLAKALGLHWPN